MNYNINFDLSNTKETEDALFDYFSEPGSELEYSNLVITNTFTPEDDAECGEDTQGLDLTARYHDIELRHFNWGERWKLVSHITGKQVPDVIKAFELLSWALRYELPMDCDCCEPDCPICQEAKEAADMRFQDTLDYHRSVL